MAAPRLAQTFLRGAHEGCVGLRSRMEVRNPPPCAHWKAGGGVDISPPCFGVHKRGKVVSPHCAGVHMDGLPGAALYASVYRGGDAVSPLYASVCAEVGTPFLCHVPRRWGSQPSAQCWFTPGGEPFLPSTTGEHKGGVPPRAGVRRWGNLPSVQCSCAWGWACHLSTWCWSAQGRGIRPTAPCRCAHG